MRGAGSEIKFNRAKAEFSRARGDPKFSRGDCNADLAGMVQNSTRRRSPVGRSQRSSRTPGPREILVVQLSRRAVENSKVSRVQATAFQEGRDRSTRSEKDTWRSLSRRNQSEGQFTTEDFWARNADSSPHWILPRQLSWLGVTLTDDSPAVSRKLGKQCGIGTPSDACSSCGRARDGLLARRCTMGAGRGPVSA